MDVLVGTALTIGLELQGPAGSLPPVNNSATYTLHDHSGNILSGPTPVTTTPDMTSVSIQINAGNHTIGGSRKFEKRLLRFNWTSGGNSYEIRRPYRVIPFLNVSVGPADVRAMLGVTNDELGDDDIDIVAAYFQIESEVTTSVLTTALAAGDVTELAINRAITAQAALATIPSLSLRVASSVSDGVQKFARLTGIKLDRLAAEIAAVRAQALAEAQGETSAVFTGIALTTPTDVITGA